MVVIRATSHPVDIASVRELWSEYWAEAGLDEGFQGFAAELASLPGPYQLLLAAVDGEVAGTIAMRRNDERSCEAKRLYVRPRFRGSGVATTLLRALTDLARSQGYLEMYGDTLPAMAKALGMYRAIGFQETGPYNDHPTPGAIYLRLPL